MLPIELSWLGSPFCLITFAYCNPSNYGLRLVIRHSRAKGKKIQDVKVGTQLSILFDNIVGGKTHKQFLQDAIERSSPGNARFLAELFGGLELSLELGDGAQVKKLILIVLS